MKKFLYVLRQMNYQGVLTQECIDVILTCAAFEQSVSLLLLDDSVFCLKAGQVSQDSCYKNTQTLFSLLETMEIEQICVESESLSERGLLPEMLSLAVRQIPRQEIGQWMSTFDCVIAD